MSTILVADDNTANRELLSAILERAGFDVAEAKDGADALQHVRLQQPDLLLLDIHLPDMDGFEVLRQVRQDSRASTLLVAAVTASAMDGDQEKALGHGFDAYLIKPYDPPEVVTLVRSLLDRKG